MKADSRREKIIDIISDSKGPITASKLAKKFGVSRQIIVGDISLLRAEGYEIASSPRGYMMEEKISPYPYMGALFCRHGNDQLEEELNIIVDYGGTCIDVIVEHGIYGELVGQLNISSRHDVKLFMKKIESKEKPLSALSDGLHKHHIGCKDEEIFNLIKEKLDEKGILVKED